KTYGPHQTLMVVRRALGQALPNQGHFFNGATLYKRFTPAGPDHAQVAACAGIADYIDRLADHLGTTGTPAARAAAVHDAMRAREVELLAPLLDYVTSRNSLRLIGPADPAIRAPTVAVAADRPGAELSAALVPHGINAAGGDFYAVRPLTAMGVDPDHGVLRMSFTHYTTEDEVDRLIAALDRIL
ncbi:MAG: aminotransferase class V-fold PLP-dependent enzyme, partial [Pseudomonadota bacterium]